jgi:predicted ATP-binding protein involved in virulence
MNINKIKLTNFRAFESFELELNPGFNLIIGNNAKGKTSILDGLATGASCLFNGFPMPATAKRIRAKDVRQRFFESGQRITAEAQSPCKIQCEGVVNGTSEKWGVEVDESKEKTNWILSKALQPIAMTIQANVKSNDPSQSLPVVAHYGTERLWKQISTEEETKTLPPETRFAGYRDCLNPASNEKRLFEWFKTAELTALQQSEKLGDLEACRRAIVTCIPDATHVYYDVAFDQMILKSGDESIPFQYLSDGYRNMLAVVADLAVRCATLNPQMGEDATNCEGMVLIDEIDLHLHPKWQRRVVADLINAFPKIQFIATTHSPFIIQSLPPNHDVKLINLDNGELDNFTDRSVEDIVEWVQGVELPQRSQRHVEMMKTAEEYFSLLDDDSEASANDMSAKREELQKAIQVHTDNPAYHAFIRMKEIAGEKANGSKERFKGRNRSVVDPDDIESKRDEGSDGEMMSGGSE